MRHTPLDECHHAPAECVDLHFHRLKQLNSLCHYLVKRAAEVLGSFKNSLALFLNPVFAICRISIDRHELDDGQDCEGLDG